VTWNIPSWWGLSFWDFRRKNVRKWKKNTYPPVNYHRPYHELEVWKTGSTKTNCLSRVNVNLLEGSGIGQWSSHFGTSFKRGFSNKPRLIAVPVSEWFIIYSPWPIAGIDPNSGLSMGVSFSYWPTGMHIPGYSAAWIFACDDSVCLKMGCWGNSTILMLYHHYSICCYWTCNKKGAVFYHIFRQIHGSGWKTDTLSSWAQLLFHAIDPQLLFLMLVTKREESHDFPAEYSHFFRAKG